MAAEHHRGFGKGAMCGSAPRSSGIRGFTLIELLVSTAIMLTVMLVLLQVIAGMTNIWHNSSGTISSFQSARAAFTTLTRTLSRATLKTYIDYVDSNGNPISNTSVNSSNGASFVPIASFSRSSELMFVCGPSANMGAVLNVSSTVPGDCVFFQAPLGIINGAIDATNVAAGKGSDKFLQKSLNSLGFYVAYNTFNNTGTIPTWLAKALNIATATTPPRFRLMEYIQPTEDVTVYKYTDDPVDYPPAGPASSTYNVAFNFITQALNASSTAGTVTATTQSTVVAENIPLLIIRPRIESADEQTLANSTTGPLALATTSPIVYSSTTANSIISPNYCYDSRAWWGGYAIPGASPNTRVLNSTYAKLMRNQLPPILDVAMVAVDANSIIRFGNPTVPPSQLTVQASYTGNAPNGTAYATQIVTANPPFSNSVNMDIDLYNYGLWLASNHVRYRIFRASVQMEGAAWVDN
jgi:uncharacterized protein (TIGR02599 family)